MRVFSSLSTFAWYFLFLRSRRRESRRLGATQVRDCEFMESRAPLESRREQDHDQIVTKSDRVA